MIVTKRQLQIIIKEEVERQYLEQLDEGMMEKVLAKAEKMLAKIGPKAAEWIVNFIKDNPEIGKSVVGALNDLEEIACGDEGILKDLGPEVQAAFDEL
jgi:hypothetical protein